jgi:translation initiation factor 1
MNKKDKSLRDLTDLRGIFGMDPLPEGEQTNRENESTDQRGAQHFNNSKVRIFLDRLKGNKESTRIIGLNLLDDQLKDLSTKLKKQCGVGGTFKEGAILLQGNHREKVKSILESMGFKDVKIAGG